ncbi:hypothetical protein [Streptomyces sp. NPDC004728]|uniref:hypothetical protein n=1 Tax=Streptomyces sp. NPDC004728 TaxID=3154289 RepID=UPI0033B6F343
MKERRPYDSDAQHTTVRWADSWCADAGWDVESEQEAREAMALPGARGCSVCGTDLSLQ